MRFLKCHFTSNFVNKQRIYDRHSTYEVLWLFKIWHFFFDSHLMCAQVEVYRASPNQRKPSQSESKNQGRKYDFLAEITPIWKSVWHFLLINDDRLLFSFCKKAQVEQKRAFSWLDSHALNLDCTTISFTRI